MSLIQLLDYIEYNGDLHVINEDVIDEFNYYFKNSSNSLEMISVAIEDRNKNIILANQSGNNYSIEYKTNITTPDTLLTWFRDSLLKFDDCNAKLECGNYTCNLDIYNLTDEQIEDICNKFEVTYIEAEVLYKKAKFNIQASYNQVRIIFTDTIEFYLLKDIEEKLGLYDA